MYIKVFESRQTSKSYTVFYQPGIDSQGKHWIENENHTRVPINENQLYQLIDNIFKAQLKELIEANE